MRQRVGIARALVVRPAVLLMDEPLSALDAQTRDLLMEDFLDLWLRERVAGVYVTHNFHECLRLAEESWYCRAGRAGSRKWSRCAFRNASARRNRRRSSSPISATGYGP